MKPEIIRQGQYGKQQLQSWKDSLKIWRQKDIIESQLAEYYEILNPAAKFQLDFSSLEKDYITQELGESPELVGDWIYFPWNGECLHVVDASRFYELRTNRNQNLINKVEQHKLADTKVAIAGLSVGSGIASGLVYSGISGNFNLADFDLLSTTNLNRVHYGISGIGESKLDLACQHIYSLNPYANIQGFGKLSDDKLGAFLEDVDVVFDEIDDFAMKVTLRMKAKKMKVPLIMLTSLGDRILIDVERYDSAISPEIFNGLLGIDPNEILKGQIGEAEKIKYAMQTVGINNIPTRALMSLKEINKSLVGRPQLYGTVAMDGGLGPYLVRQLILRDKPKSGRYQLDLNAVVGLSEDDQDKRSAILDELKKMT